MLYSEINKPQVINLLNSSKGKDIVLFFGNTKSTKSTIINFISGKNLYVNDHLKIDCNEKVFMKIGYSKLFGTYNPSFIETEDYIYYDLPGF